MGSKTVLTDSQMERVRAFAVERSVRAGETLYQPDDVTPCIYVVLAGALEIVSVGGGKDVVVATYRRGEFSGELLMISGRRSIYRCRVVETGRVLEVSPTELRALLARDADLAEVVMAAFVARRATLREDGHGNVVVVGRRTSARTLALRDFLVRDGHPFSYFDIDSDSRAEKILQRFGANPADEPVVVCNDRDILRDPSPATLAERLGFNSRAAADRVRDVVIVGGGPAGLAAAVYAASEGLDVVVVEKSAPGGQAGSSSKIENYLGFPTGLSGGELAARALAQAEKFGADFMVARAVTGLDCTASPYRLALDDGSELRARAIVLATGAQYNKLPLANLDRFTGRGIHYSATFMEAQLVAGEEIIVVGGGNSAGQAAIFLANSAASVRLVVRGGRLEDTMSRYLVDRIKHHPRITLSSKTELTSLEGEADLEHVRWRSNETGVEDGALVRHVFLMTGASPKSDWLAGCVARDAKGFVLAGRDAALDAPRPWTLAREPFMLETSLPGVFAVGDARSGSVKRVASAVGEGAIVIHFIHQTLAMAAAPASGA